MIAAKLKRASRLRALAALVLLIAGWLADPLSLAALSSSGCGMECCLNGESSSCETRHTADDSDPESSDTSLNQSAQFSAPCPGTCSSGIGYGRGQHQPLALHSFVLPGGSIETLHFNNFGAEEDLLLHSGSAPRAPPRRS
jgi:hypothetical protein